MSDVKPSSWIECIDEDSGYPYYFNPDTGESLWEKPDDFKIETAKEWMKCFDDDGTPYYYNEDLRKSTWTAPPGFSVGTIPSKKESVSSLTETSSRYSESSTDSSPPARPKKPSINFVTISNINDLHKQQQEQQQPNMNMLPAKSSPNVLGTNRLGPPPKTPPRPDKKGKRKRKGIGQRLSAFFGFGRNEKKSQYSGVMAKLTHWLKGRPHQEALVSKGILQEPLFGYEYIGLEGSCEGEKKEYEFSMDLPAPPAYDRCKKIYISSLASNQNGEASVLAFSPSKVAVRRSSISQNKEHKNNKRNSAQISKSTNNPIPQLKERPPSAPTIKADIPNDAAGETENLPEDVQFQRGDLLGKGGFGKVYRALNIATGTIFAVKEIEVADGSEDQQQKMADFKKEVDLMKKLRHNNILRYLGVQTRPHTVRIFLELAQDSLISMIRKFDRLEEGVVRSFTTQILNGLEYLHENKIIHRDIKGANILLGTDGHLKLADFGASRSVEDMLGDEQIISVVGTPYWMAPEVMTDNGYSTKADIWSVGCVVVEMITGQHPYADINQFAAIFQISQGKPPPYPNDDFSKELQDFLSKCFVVDPSKRPGAAELLKHPFITNTPL